jgi:DNA-binding NarL/FixJ family response regulator
VTIRVAIADDTYLVREGLKRLLERGGDYQVVTESNDLPSLLEAIDRVPPDVVVTDIRMPPTSTDEGVRAAALLRESHPNLGVVVLSQYLEPEYAIALLEGGSGGRAYLLKERVSQQEHLLAAIREVQRGGSVIDPAVVDALVTGRSRARSAMTELTDREHAVLGAMAEGKSNAGISSDLALSARAVEKHINAVFTKLGLTEERDVNRRVKAVLVFLAQTGAG